MCNCQLLVILTLFSYIAGTQLRHEELYVIQQLLAENKGLVTSPAVGPMRLILNNVQIHCLQQLIPACALDTILVANIWDMDSVAKLLKNRFFPVPEIEITDFWARSGVVRQSTTTKSIWRPTSKFTAILICR